MMIELSSGGAGARTYWLFSMEMADEMKEDNVLKKSNKEKETWLSYSCI